MKVQLAIANFENNRLYLIVKQDIRQFQKADASGLHEGPPITS